MDILLIVATLVVAVAGLYVAATFNWRTRKNFTPLIDGALKDVTAQIEAMAEDLRGRIRAIADDLQRDQDQARLDARKTQGRLDHADSRMTSLAHQISTDLDTIRRLVERVGAREAGGEPPTGENPQAARHADTAAGISGAPVLPPQATWWERPSEPPK
jgi:hypothetical protein